MAWSPTEYLEVAVPAPMFVATVDDRWVVSPDYVYRGSSQPGNVPRFTVAVMDATTNSAELYEGIGWAAVVDSTAGYAWISSNASDPQSNSASARSLIKLDPATGTNTSYTAPTLTVQTKMCSVGTHIWLLNGWPGGTTNIERFEISTSTWDTPFSGGTEVHSCAWDGGSYVYLFYASSVVRVHVSSGSSSTVTPSGYVSPAGVAIARDPYGVLWYHVFGKIYRWQPGVSFSSFTTVSGDGFSGCYGGDGFMYFVPSGSDRLVVCDLAGTSSGDYTLSPSRAARQAVARAAGKLFIPAGAPYTR